MAVLRRKVTYEVYAVASVKAVYQGKQCSFSLCLPCRTHFAQCMDGRGLSEIMLDYMRNNA